MIQEALVSLVRTEVLVLKVPLDNQEFRVLQVPVIKARQETQGGQGLQEHLDLLGKGGVPAC